MFKYFHTDSLEYLAFGITELVELKGLPSYKIIRGAMLSQLRDWKLNSGWGEIRKLNF